MQRWETILLGGSLVLSCCLPLLAQYQLNNKVQEDLANRASLHFGIPIQLGEASVGLSGTLEIRDVRIGNVVDAKRVIAAVGHEFRASEILIDGPHASIRFFADGTNNIDSLRNTSVPRNSQVTADSHSPNDALIRVQNGSLDVEFAQYGHLQSKNIDIEMQGASVHMVFGDTAVDMQKDSWHLLGKIPRAAVDYRRHGAGLQRFLADGGRVRLEREGHTARMEDLVVGHNIGDKGWMLRGKTGLSRIDGEFVMSIAERPNQPYRVDIKASDAPLFFAAPFLPKMVSSEMTRLSGTITALVPAELQHTVTAAMDISVRELHIAHSSLAVQKGTPLPLEMDLGVKANVRIHKTAMGHTVEATLDKLQSAALSLSGQISGQWSSSSFPDLAKVSLRLAEVQCDAALSSLPVALRTSLAGLELRGSMHSELDVLIDRAANRADLEVHSGIDGCRAVQEPPAADTNSLIGPFIHRDPEGHGHRLAPSPGFTDIDDIPSYVSRAFVVAEDARFFLHDGFDLRQIRRSLAIDVESGKFIRGGSTISQQLIKNVFLHRHRSLARKLQEAILTWRLEDNVRKKRILEIYINIIELGDNGTYGIYAASQRWFGIAPKDLSILQAAFLASITPEPTSMSARIRNAGGLDPLSEARVATILRVMRRGKVISSREYRRAKSETLHFVFEG